jgi:hypothetical protein
VLVLDEPMCSEEAVDLTDAAVVAVRADCVGDRDVVAKVVGFVGLAVDKTVLIEAREKKVPEVLITALGEEEPD